MSYNKTILGGHFVISFDSVINGFLAVVMAPVFFGGASDNQIIQLLSSYAAYAALFVTGPLGAITFGRMGDKFGRKNTLLLSIIGIGVPVLVIGLLPPCSVIGIVAPLALILLRMMQGFFKGVEYAGVLIHSYETGKKRISSSAGIISFGCIGGSVAAVICWFVTMDPTRHWAWRLPYVIGGFLALILFLFRMKIPETDEFIEISTGSKILKSPLKDLFTNNKMEALVSVAVSALYTAFAYSSMIFGNRLFQQAGYTISQSMIFSAVDLLWISTSIAICGKIADRIGLVKQMKYGAMILIVTTIPVCSLIAGELTLTKIYSYMFINTFLSATIASCSAAYILRLFPVHCRYTGFAITDSMGSILGGITPFMLLLLSSTFHSNFGCAVWLLTLTVPTFVLICWTEKVRQLQDDRRN
ncbi:MAG: MFS transporter [Holosporales bacterium]|jgi:MHS family proline/betaine transporter-like MFS transporter|nr:MFS transporter [Holosporales bacterium]